MSLALYQPEKYKVYLGAGKSVGLCTVWNEPELVFNRSAAIREKVAILGTLYSRHGVNVILRNLALNPTIRTLYLWGHGALSNTAFGLAGRTILEQFWRAGVEADGTVSGTKFKLEKEIKPAILEKIRAAVRLEDLSDRTLSEVEKLIEAAGSSHAAKASRDKPYMSPVAFPPAVPEAVEVFPSETVGWLVRGRSILDAWSRVVERIMRYGVIKGTQYGYQQRELIGVTWLAASEDPDDPDLSLAADWPQELRQLVGASADSLREYFRVFLSPECPPGIAYTYGNRLQRYPHFVRLGRTSRDKPGNINQIEEVIIKQMRASPDSRRAVATTMVPSIDKDSKEPPCLTQIQTLQSGGALHLLATVRSHDIFKAGLPNAFGLRTIQKKIAATLGFTLGQLQITSQSAHIYEQDWTEAFKLTRCLFWEREPSLTFNPATQSDPRGNFIITIEGDELVATLQGPEGETLLKLTGPSAKHLAKKITQLELLARTDHLADVAMELQKAEIAKERGLNYQQDRNLVF